MRHLCGKSDLQAIRASDLISFARQAAVTEVEDALILCLNCVGKCSLN